MDLRDLQIIDSVFVHILPSVNSFLIGLVIYSRRRALKQSWNFIQAFIANIFLQSKDVFYMATDVEMGIVGIIITISQLKVTKLFTRTKWMRREKMLTSPGSKTYNWVSPTSDSFSSKQFRKKRKHVR